MDEINIFFKWIGTWNTNIPITTWVINNIILLFAIGGLGAWIASLTRTEKDDTFWSMFKDWVNKISRGNNDDEE